MPQFQGWLTSSHLTLPPCLDLQSASVGTWPFLRQGSEKRRLGLSLTGRHTQLGSGCRRLRQILAGVSFILYRTLGTSGPCLAVFKGNQDANHHSGGSNLLKTWESALCLWCQEKALACARLSFCLRFERETQAKAPSAQQILGFFVSRLHPMGQWVFPLGGFWAAA